MVFSEFWHGPFKALQLGCYVVFLICAKIVSGIPVTSASVSILNLAIVLLTI